MSTMTLEPCPFCGAKDAEVYPRDRSNLAWNVCCGNPGCVTRGDNDYLTKSDAVAAWNRRAHLAKFTPDWAGYQQRLEDGKAEERERLSQTSDDRADGDVEITYDVVHGEARVNVYTAQPAQAVDVGEPIAWAWHSDSMKGWALGHVKPTPENTERFHERNTIVRGLYFDPSALSGEKSGRVDGIAMASAYIQKKADDYAAENCGTEWDTGATTYRYGQAGEDYHHTLLELAEELAALPASPAPDKEGL